MPNFNIVISATDKATAVVNKINDRMAKVTRPLEDTRKSFKRFETAVADNPISKGLGKVSGAALGVARSVGKIAAPIAAITGVGSIAGIAMLADRWAKFGRSVSYASQELGVSTSQLQQYQGMATLAGVSTEGMVSSIGALGTTMEDARWGRNQGALMMLNRLGIGLKKTKSGAWDVNAEMMAVAKVMTNDKLKNNPWAQSLIANQLGMSALLPMLRQGEQGMKKYQDMQQRLGYISSPEDIQNANQFAQSLAGLQISAEGLGQSLMDKAMPALKPFIDDLSSWIGKNRELISTDVASWIKTIADYVSKVNWKDVGNGITGFFTDAKGSATGLKTVLDDIVATFQKISDFKNGMQYGFQNGGAVEQALGVGGEFTNADNAMYASQHGQDKDFAARRDAMLKSGQIGSLDFYKKSAGWMERLLPASQIQSDYQDYIANNVAKSFLDPGSFKNLPSSGGKGGGVRGGVQNSNAAVKFFQSQGWTQNQAAGIAANLGEESGFDPNATGDKGTAYGAAQWHKDRQQNFEKWAGHSIKGSSLDEQMRFVQYELTQGTEKDAGDRLRRTNTAYEAGSTVSRFYERPGAQDEAAANRGSQATAIANQGPYSSGAATAQGGAVHVQVDLKNAPPGTTAKATTTGNTTASPPRIGYSTVGAAAA